MSRVGPGLTDRALERLREGPASSHSLAQDVLGLTGPPGALSAAVHALLRGDPRVRVDGDGTWSLAPFAGVTLADARFAVVDVETTGGSFGGGHRVLEIAVVDVHRGRIGEVWSTLVNPGRPVPFGIHSLTGISDEMAFEAPYFEHVAPEVSRRLEGRVFVAHNATFDWRFVRGELVRATGSAPDLDRLCTVRLVRRLVPRLRRRNLDAVAGHFGVPIHARHRAHGDALATARVLLRLLEIADSLGLKDLDAVREYVSRYRPRPRRRVRAGGPQ